MLFLWKQSTLPAAVFSKTKSPPDDQDKTSNDGASKETRETASHAVGSESTALYPIYQANVSDSNVATGSN